MLAFPFRNSYRHVRFPSSAVKRARTTPTACASSGCRTCTRRYEARCALMPSAEPIFEVETPSELPAAIAIARVRAIRFPAFRLGKSVTGTPVTSLATSSTRSGSGRRCVNGLISRSARHPSPIMGVATSIGPRCRTRLRSSSNSGEPGIRTVERTCSSNSSGDAFTARSSQRGLGASPMYARWLVQVESRAARTTPARTGLL